MECVIVPACASGFWARWRCGRPTPKGAIAVYSADREKLWIYDGYHDFSEGHPEDLVAQVAAELGENYVEMLDI
jgi:hypothetical protein